MPKTFFGSGPMLYFCVWINVAENLSASDFDMQILKLD